MELKDYYFTERTIDDEEELYLNLVMEKGVPLNVWLKNNKGKIEEAELNNIFERLCVIGFLFEEH